MQNILIADDNKQITSVLEEYALKEGFNVTVVHDGEEALKAFKSQDFDVLLLDVMMPLLDGFSVCREIRKTSNVPILMITARGEDYEKIMGLEIGADDYIVKPFSPGEVFARVKAVLRRIGSQEKSIQVFTFDNLVVNLDDYTVTVAGENVLLTKKELEILWTLANSMGHVFSREALLNALWGYDYYGDSRTVDSHIKRLRAKLDRLEHPAWGIKTIWGVGYRFEVKDDDKK